MPYFKDQKEMHDIQRAFFERLATDPEVGPKLREAGLVIRFQVHDPAGSVTIDCRGEAGEGRYFVTALGENDLRPDITLTSSADLSHEFWQGRVNIINALFSGKVKAAGNVTQAMKFVPALKPIADIYKDVLTSLGRQDLILK
ncbi:MAG: SCP2 sterol-binding domain-containing protein [Candidatus Aminicenantales bacterium]